MFVNITVT